MSDRIFVDNLRLACSVGITPQERRRSQEVLVDVSLFMNLKRAGMSDDVKDTVNYKEVLALVTNFISSKKFGLLENLAYSVADALLEAYPAESVRVSVRKAKYSSEPSIGVEIIRDRKSWSSRS